MSESSAVLYDIDGDPMSVENGTPIPPLTSVLIGGGSDGTNAQFIRVNSDGYQIIIGSGLAGAPAGGLLTIQGDALGIPIPISGTVTANAGSGNFAVVQATAANLLASVGGLGAADVTPVGNPVLIAGSDGSTTRTIRTASDGTVRIDPTGTTIQPISGTVTANAGTGTFNIAGTVTANIGTTGGLALDSTLAKLTIAPGTAIGSNTLAMVGGHVTTVSPTYTNGNINPLSLTTSGALRIDGSGVTQPVSGTVTSNQGTANTLANRWPVIVTDGTNTQPTGDVIARSIFHQISDGTTGPVAVKPASTVPVTSDKALVVVLSPNQPSIPVNFAPASANTGIRTGTTQLGGGTSGTLQAIRATTYTEPSSNAQRSISSSSASDTSAGVGARTVMITYYTVTGTGPFTETITLNGTTAVNTVATDICYIEKMDVVTVGSSNYNIGTITLWSTTGGGGTAIGTIGIGNIAAGVGDGQTLWAHHYVPLSTTATLATFVVSAQSGGSGTIARFFLRSKKILVPNSIEATISEILLNIGTITRVLSIPIKDAGFSRITAYGVPGVNNALLAASFDYSEQ